MSLGLDLNTQVFLQSNKYRIINVAFSYKITIKTSRFSDEQCSPSDFNMGDISTGFAIFETAIPCAFSSSITVNTESTLQSKAIIESIHLEQGPLLFCNCLNGLPVTFQLGRQAREKLGFRFYFIG